MIGLRWLPVQAGIARGKGSACGERGKGKGGGAVASGEAAGKLASKVVTSLADHVRS